MKISEDQEDILEWLQEIEEDSAEAAEFEFYLLHSLIEEEVPAQRMGGLLIKLEAHPDQSFSISRYSTYKSDRWILERPLNESERRVLFNSELAGGNDLKKMLTYYLLPQFHPLGRIRSFISTVTYAWAYTLIEQYLFRPNGLDATPESIRTISVRLINEALDRAQIEGTPRQYFLLYFILTFWVTLSSNALIPITHRLDVPLRLIDTKERQTNIQNAIQSEHKGWQSFTEEELSLLIKYALFWTETAMPALLSIKDFLEKHLISEHSYGCFRRTESWKEFEALLGQEIDGIVVCGFSLTEKIPEVNRLSENDKRGEYFYRWKHNYKEAVDKVRDGILILVSLISGMRKRELGKLIFGDISQGEDGEWVINITRFKTTNDPNYFGESDELPLPSFIGELVASFEKLRSFDNNMRSGLVFEQVANPRNTKLTDRSISRAMRNLSDRTGVAGVHPHRCRKTIAEILINRSERNIDLIRMLFGHKSFKMTLRYIARNPYLVQSIADTMEVHYTEAFIDIVTAVRNGSYSGAAAERIANVTSAHSELFRGQLLRMTVFCYVAYLLEAGEPLFIKRTSVGMYCVSSDAYSLDTLPPCRTKLVSVEGQIIPDTSNCQLDCKRAVVLGGAKETLERNILFYTRLLDKSSDNLKKSARREIVSKISINQKHLSALNMNRTQPLGSVNELVVKS